MDEKTITRFWAKVDKRGECWLWTAADNSNGYGVFRLNYPRRQAYAHRLSWLLANGHDAAELQVCHRCDVRRCVNPAHLFLGTASDNLANMRNKGRGSAPPRVIRLGENNHSAKLTPGIVRAIRERAALGEPMAPISRELGVSSSTVEDAVNFRTWRHIR